MPANLITDIWRGRYWRSQSLYRAHLSIFTDLGDRRLKSPALSPAWGDRDDYMETSDRPNRPDRLEMFSNDWGADRDDPKDHMETRL